MFKLAIVSLLCAQAFAGLHEPEIESHVVGGTQAKEGEFPFTVSVRNGSGIIQCGGALLSDKYVVTAAYCVAEEKVVKIGAGSINLNKQKEFVVDKIIVHPDYVAFGLINDIALLRLKTPVKLDKNTQAINFPVNENLDGKTVTALGWGRTSPDDAVSQDLMYLRRPILNTEACSKQLNFNILDSQICLQGEKNSGMCTRDFGGPLAHKGTDGKNHLVGVYSWGIPRIQGFPEVFTRISHFADWIKQNMV